MAVQSSIFNIDTGVTFPSTKTIATKQHMAVWLRDTESGDWEQLNVLRYDLINNSAVILSAEYLIGFSALELRVADNPNELGVNPANIAIVAGNIDEVIICAENIASIVEVGDDIDSVVIVANDIESVVTCANNIGAILDAPTAANGAMINAWYSKADAMTSASYSNQPIGEYVNI